MKFDLFIEKVREYVEGYCMDNGSISKEGEDNNNSAVIINVVEKNNGVKLHGLSIKEKTQNISATVYLEEYYEEYQKNGDFEGICRDIVSKLNQNNLHRCVNVDFLKEFEKIKNRVFPKVINYEKNKEGLLNMPYRKVHDLAVIYYVSCDNIIDGGVIVIKNDLFSRWQISEDKLYEIAINNIELLEPKMISIEKMILNIELGRGIGKDWIDIRSDVDDENMEKIKSYFRNDTSHMFVVSNAARRFGSSLILSGKLMKFFADCLGKSFYILPSSVHELIILAVADSADCYEIMNLKEIVKSVNQTSVDEIDFLSDEVYLYNFQRDEITICKN